MGRYCMASSSSVQTLHIQRPRNKYLDVRRAYLAYSKLRKRKKSQTRMITRRLLQLLEKLLDQLEQLHSSYRNRLTLSSDYQRRFSVIQTVLEQGKNLFAGKKVSNRIVSIDRHYLRPIIRGTHSVQRFRFPYQCKGWHYRIRVGVTYEHCRHRYKPLGLSLNGIG